MLAPLDYWPSLTLALASWAVSALLDVSVLLGGTAAAVAAATGLLLFVTLVVAAVLFLSEAVARLLDLTSSLVGLPLVWGRLISVASLSVPFP